MKDNIDKKIIEEEVKKYLRLHLNMILNKDLTEEQLHNWYIMLKEQIE